MAEVGVEGCEGFLELFDFQMRDVNLLLEEIDVAQLFGGAFVCGFAVDEGFARLREQQTGHDFQQGGFAGAVAAEQPVQVAGLQLPVHPVEELAVLVVPEFYIL